MNNACPSCGAVYAVAAKDVGRKIKCKKCGSALIVSEDGLVEDAPVPSAPARGRREEDEEEVDEKVEEEQEEEEEEEAPKSKKGKKDKSKPRSGGGGGLDINAALAKVGGIPTLLFGFGVFLVIWFTFMARIGDAAVIKAASEPQRLKLEQTLREQSALPKGKYGREELNDDERKIYDGELTKIRVEFTPKQREAINDLADSEITNSRDIKGQRYGLLFGFLLVSFGCIGYLRTDQPLTMRIVAAVILTFMMIVMFSAFGGCGHDSPAKSLLNKA